MRLSYTYLESPIGTLLLAGDSNGLQQILFSIDGRPARPNPDWEENPSALGQAIRQLEAYFAGKLDNFNLLLSPQGTPFQQRVWSELQKIPYGETISYGELARRIGNPKASRAVGLANGANPLSIVIPCHRVIGANGKLTGYGKRLADQRKTTGARKATAAAAVNADFLEGYRCSRALHFAPPSGNINGSCFSASKFL
jgi:methylated-DNA-[protein]-cysteine S-methyltransferase